MIYPRKCRGKHGPHLISGPDDERKLTGDRRVCRACALEREHAAGRRYREAHRERVLERGREKAMQRYYADLDGMRARQRKAKRDRYYQMTEEEYSQLLSAQRRYRRAKADERDVDRMAAMRPG